MIEEIKTEVKVHILHSKWMNNSTKEFMIAKMDNLIPQVGYPKWYNNQTALIERYEGVGNSMYVIGDNIKKHVTLKRNNKMYVSSCQCKMIISKTTCPT